MNVRRGKRSRRSLRLQLQVARQGARLRQLTVPVRPVAEVVASTRGARCGPMIKCVI